MDIALSRFGSDPLVTERRLRVWIGGSGLSLVMLLTLAGASFAGHP